MFGPEISKEDLLVEIEEIIRTMPDSSAFRQRTPESQEWLGRASAAVGMWDSDPAAKAEFVVVAPYLQTTGHIGLVEDYFDRIATILHQVQNNLRFRTVGPLNSAIEHGMLFAYFNDL